VEIEKNEGSVENKEESESSDNESTKSEKKVESESEEEKEEDQKENVNENEEGKKETEEVEEVKIEEVEEVQIEPVEEVQIEEVEEIKIEPVEEVQIEPVEEVQIPKEEENSNKEQTEKEASIKKEESIKEEVPIQEENITEEIDFQMTLNKKTTNTIVNQSNPQPIKIQEPIIEQTFQNEPEETETMSFPAPTNTFAKIQTEVKASPVQNPQDELKHVVRYKVKSPEPAQVNTRFHDVKFSPIKREDVAGPTYISGRVQVQRTPEKRVYANNIQGNKIERSPQIIKKGNYNGEFNNGNYYKNGQGYRIIHHSGESYNNEEKMTSSIPITRSYNPSYNANVVNSEIKRNTPYKVIQGESINRFTMPSQTERDQIYSRRFKHLKLVEQTKDYKRFQYTTKSREKVNWSWKRGSRMKVTVQRSNENSLKDSKTSQYK
jgi:hypothetical protein